MNEIICGNNTDVLPTLEADSVDLTVTSPPYDNLRDYKGYTFDVDEVIKGLMHVTKPGGVVVWITADSTKDGCESGTSMRTALRFMDYGWSLFDTMIYEKPIRAGIGSNYGYWQAWEYMFVFCRGSKPRVSNLINDRRNIYVNDHRGSCARNIQGVTPKTRRRITLKKYGRRTNIWKINKGGGHTTKDKIAYKHPALFPEALARDHILSWSNPGDTVLDPFAGSGTTCKMAKLLSRKYIGIEISKEYVELAERRLRETPEPLEAYQ